MLLRNETQHNFTMVDNYILRNPNVSLKAIGMYAKLSSLPDNWKFTEAGLTSICKGGKEIVRTALKELEELGLLFRFRIRNKDGTMGDSVYYISSTPMEEETKKEVLERYNPLEIIETSATDQSTEKPILVKPILEKSTQYNTNIYNTNNIYNKEIYKESASLPEPYEELQQHFEDIWSEYPNKKGKNKAYKHYFTWIKGKEYCGKKVKLTARQMWYAVQNYLEEIRQKGTQTQYIKHGDTFFNNIIEYVQEDDDK